MLMLALFKEKRKLCSCSPYGTTGNIMKNKEHNNRADRYWFCPWLLCCAPLSVTQSWPKGTVVTIASVTLPYHGFLKANWVRWGASRTILLLGLSKRPRFSHLECIAVLQRCIQTIVNIISECKRCQEE